jgi:hypothetical protein
MSHAGSGETGAGAFYLHEASRKTLPWLGGTSRPLALATSFATALVDFDFEPLFLVMTQHQLDGQPAEGWSQPVLGTNSLSP